MSDLVVQIRFAEEFEEWLPSYPGDPMVRPSKYVYSIRYNEHDLLKDWLDKSTPGALIEGGMIKWKSGGLYGLGLESRQETARLFPDSFHESKVHFKDKKQAMLFKLAFS